MKLEWLIFSLLLVWIDKAFYIIEIINENYLKKHAVLNNASEILHFVTSTYFVAAAWWIYNAVDDVWMQELLIATCFVQAIMQIFRICSFVFFSIQRTTEYQKQFWRLTMQFTHVTGATLNGFFTMVCFNTPLIKNKWNAILKYLKLSSDD